MNAHSVLGVESSATPEQIKAAYRKLAMKHHPDRNPESAEAKKKFQEIQDAYDSLRVDKPKQRQSQENPQDFHMHMHDVFDQFFRRQQAGNPNLQAQCSISLEQAFSGCTISFAINGKDIAVDIPSGINHGQAINIPGAAGQPNAQYPPGDLHVIVVVNQHSMFHRQGMTLLSRVKIDLLDLITGTEIDVPTIMGKTIKVKVPENSNPESVVVVTGEGMTAIGTPQRGDLMLHFEVSYPTFTPAQLKTLSKMKKS